MNILCILLFLFSTPAFSSGGNDKNPLWSAKALGIGGAYSSSVKNSDAIFFNPAGLSEDSLTYSFGVLAVEGKVPIVRHNDRVTNPVTFSPLPAVTYSRELTPKWRFGIGAYPAGGLNVVYPDVNYSGVDPAFAHFTPDSKVSVAILELSPGVSYEIMPRLRIGAALRLHHVQGGLGQSKIVRLPDGTIIAATSTELKGADNFSYQSFRFGLQYRSEDDKFGIGLVHRTPITFNLDSKIDGKIVYTAAGSAVVNAGSGGAITPVVGQEYTLKGNDIDATTSLPMNWSLGGDYKLSMQHHLFYEYTYTQYSNNKVIGLSGKVENKLTGEVTQLEDLNVRWHDMHEFRLGYELTEVLPFIMRAGYIYSTSVSNNKFADPSFQPPGTIQHYTLGTGHDVNLFNRDMLLDTALEYYSGGSKAQTEKTASSDSIKGNYTFHAMTLAFSLGMLL